MKPLNLTKRERQIMNIFWNSDKPLSANDIAVQQQDLSKNTIQAVVRKLKNHDLLKVADIGYSGTVLTRLYSPNVTQEDFLAAELSDQSLLNLIANFIETNKDIDTLNNLEKMITERQGELKK
ncbi:BlaI/MecI/CopY family transcriptional regulator [Enterococcus casseliflavus]|uniref:BlaI/MecI/CopY family transcriptional regulator n=1 Tax=Enterococcus casseliflavus TaxID=37734 RepID=UPI0018A8FDE3|nr:BlaI/MecI/CopY family transcriptional regulator [Enterococcus casseliflavus]